MLKKLNLTNYGIHKSKEVIFEEGTNIIHGENRTGKTQIMESVSFAYFGKTQNSKLEKIINFEADKAEVNLVDDKLEVNRTRTNSGSSLSKIKKHELDSLLNLDYQEFLSIFYISSSEQKSLFDSSYLRNFLISLFDLDKYSKKYQELKYEYKALQDLNVEVKKVNQDILKKRFERVKRLMDNEKEQLNKYEEISNKISKALNTLSSKEGEIRAERSQHSKQYKLLKQGKCFECARPYSEEERQTGLKKIQAIYDKLEERQKVLNSKRKEINLKDEKCDKLIRKFTKRINRCRDILVTLKEKSKEKPPVVNFKRIKELEQIISIFDPKGFPSYLLQVYIPVITSTANDLLNTIFQNMEISIRTEKQTSSKPDFKPFVKREENILELNELSGSERVLVNLCFRISVLIIFKRLKETCLDTIFIDEGIEKVDNNNSLKLLNLFNSVINMGYLKQIIIISHKDILKEQDNIHYIKLGENK